MEEKINSETISAVMIHPLMYKWIATFLSQYEHQYYDKVSRYYHGIVILHE